MAATAKSAAGEAPSKDNDMAEIVVILHPKSPFLIPERRLVLTPSHPAVYIGRSSKNQSKGFNPAGDNAWLDNPVMSREHAQLFARFDEKPHTVYLQDMQSFHGTYLTTSDGCNKGQKLVPNEPVKLTNGDTIQFGIDILRANKTYPPCLVEYIVEATAQKPDVPHRSFTVPDDVDDEEDEDCDKEDDLTITAVYTRSDPIDLTSARSPSIAPDCVIDAKLSTVDGKTSPKVIDLTSEVATGKSYLEPRTIRQSTPYRCASVADSPAPAPSLLEGRVSPQARMTLSHTSDGRIVVIPSPPPVPSDDENDYCHDLSDVELLHVGQYPESDAASDSTGEWSEISEMSDVDEPLRTYDDDDASSEMTGIEDEDELSDELSDDYAEDFDESDSLCTDPYDEESVGSYSSDEDGDEEDAATELFDAKPRTETPGLDAHEIMHYEAEAMPFFPVSLPHYNPSHDRHPSPSDAALFQRRPLLDPLPNDSRAQKLGEKSGKFEFFAAREKNRATVNQNDSTTPIGTVLETPVEEIFSASGTQSDGDKDLVATAVSNASRSVSPSLSCAPDTVAADEETDDNFEAPDTSSIKLGDNIAHQYSAWSASGDQFINHPPSESSSACQTIVSRPPAELDMTSAYMFQQSKLATAADIVSNTRRLPIEDLLAQEPKPCSIPSPPALGSLPTNYTSAPTKRSYEEAFNQSEDDVATECADRAIALCSSQIAEARDQDQTSSRPAIDRATIEEYLGALGIRKAEVHDMPEREPTVTRVQPEPPRAAKRMRLATTAAQVVACVALGSAATFSYLVNTAPVL